MPSVNSNNASDRTLPHNHPAVLANPAVATYLEYSIGLHRTTSPLTICLTFTCDANVANRYLRFTISIGALYVTIATTSTAMTANNTYHICFSQGITNYETIGATYKFVPLPQPLFLKPLNPFRIVIDNVQAGDQLSDIVMWEDQLFLN